MKRASQKRMTKKQMIGMLITVAAFIVVAAILLFSNRVVADEPVHTSYYRTVTVEKGDSLWSIAKEYAPAADNKTLSAYVENLRSINNLRRDAPLQIGQSLLVVYSLDAQNVSH